jgi:hypothetical protein
MSTFYMSPDPYFDAFNKSIDVRKYNLSKHCTAGLCLTQSDDRLFLGGMSPSTLGAKIPSWRTQLKGAWLIKVGDTIVNSIKDAQTAFAQESTSNPGNVILLFSHPEVRPDISYDGLPIVLFAPFSQQVHNQINKRWDFSTVAEYLKKALPYNIVDNGDVLNYTTKVMKLTRGKLTQQLDWADWQSSEHFQLNQYENQGMFGTLVATLKDDAVFHPVWTYNVKAVDGRKKVHCICDGSTWSGKVRILADTYANCVDQTSARMFYAIAAAENLLIYSANVSNAFAEAPPPKQGFLIRPDCAFNEWWVQHKNRPPIPHGHVIPIFSAMQGHPESPCLWEKHANKILCEIGLTPTVHEPCLYSGTINHKRVLFMQQVNDFAISAPDKCTSKILMDLIDDKLSIPNK